MTILTDEFMQEELDFIPMVENKQILFKDYYYKICQYINKVSAYSLTPNQIEQWLSTGTAQGVKVRTNVDAETRKYMFMRAMGLQLIYDFNNGRNTMVKTTNGADDICRETHEALKTIGLLQVYGW